MIFTATLYASGRAELATMVTDLQNIIANQFGVTRVYPADTQVEMVYTTDPSRYTTRIKVEANRVPASLLDDIVYDALQAAIIRDASELTTHHTPKDTPMPTTPAPSEYPVSEKLSEVTPLMTAVREFLEFAGSKNAHLLAYAGDGIGYYPVNTEDLLAECFDIDQKALEKERRAMLAKMREMHE